MNQDKIGFGCYRVQLNNQEHHKALLHALKSGVRLIDTSANYTDGQSEHLIGTVLKEMENEIPRAEITLVSKGGYIQGENMQRLEAGETIEDLVRYATGCFHSIHPDFLSNQISHSLKRLDQPYIDTYLLHNPEYYLMHEIRSDKSEKESPRAEMQARIQKAFIRLEEEVGKGRIKGYGISSNSFSKTRSDLHFLEYEHLITYAEDAAQKAGHATHHFTTIQLPFNLLEQEGFPCAKWAQAHGLKVLVNRPLNAFGNHAMHRLAEYPENPGYQSAYTNMLAQCESLGKSAAPVVQMLRDLESQITAFPWTGAIDDIIYSRAIPFINDVLSTLPDKELRHSLALALNAFLPEYIKQAKHHCSEKTKETLKQHGITIKGTLQSDALCFLLNQPELNTILVGMRHEAYVDDVMQIVQQCES